VLNRYEDWKKHLRPSDGEEGKCACEGNGHFACNPNRLTIMLWMQNNGTLQCHLLRNANGKYIDTLRNHQFICYYYDVGDVLLSIGFCGALQLGHPPLGCLGRHEQTRYICDNSR
jgi:hypothetical protein